MKMGKTAMKIIIYCLKNEILYLLSNFYLLTGVVLSMVLTMGPNRCAYLLVLDARTMLEIGRAVVDVKVAREMHGCFVSGF